MTLVITIVLLIGLWWAVRIPSSVSTMTEEEYRAYFARSIMGIDL